MEIGERLAAVEVELRSVRSDLDRHAGDIIARIDGPPWERSLRGRMHELENDAHAAKAAALALSEAQRERAQAAHERDEEGRGRRGEAWKVLGVVVAGVAVVLPYLHGIGG